MNNHFISKRIRWVVGILLLVCMVAPASPALAGQQAEGAKLELVGNLRVGQPVRAVFDLNGYEIAFGAYPSVNVRVLRGPQGGKPKVDTGFPQTVLTFGAPGSYELLFIVNEVSKPSCGGVEAKTLLEETREIVVEP